MKPSTHVFLFAPNKSGYCAGWDGTHKSRKPIAEVRIERWGEEVYQKPQDYLVCPECLHEILDKVSKDTMRTFFIRDLRK